MYFEGFTEELMLLNCSAREDSLESLGQQGDQTSQPWVFIGKTDAESEAPIFWPPDAKNQLIEKKKKETHLDSGKDWRQEEKGATENMIG